MICRVQLASHLSAFRAARVRRPWQACSLNEGRDEASHEGTGSDFAGCCQVERLLELYREKYFDLNLRRFYEKLMGRA
jgi:hypothetical protein